ncbi:hypothetical protein B0H15DRAFT_1022499 [Mycena belliarum]|uniref:DUF6532 domain-containing protein n=1 Tax=Mycena belliarum TaxID=1033014 RepID=A0AAD6XM13_9AGAR|nr:hypothetical protein B0H15DRAFT_1022499 [Mycena belliae]
MANQSKIAALATRPRTLGSTRTPAATTTTTAAGATAPAAPTAPDEMIRRRFNAAQKDKENETTPFSLHTAPVKRHTNDDDEYDDVAGDSQDDNPSDAEDNENTKMPGRADECDSADDEEPPVRSKRTRVASNKEAQRQAEKKEAANRRAAKAAHIAKRQRQDDAEPEYVPLQDTVFTSRDVELPPRKIKTLQQRDSRVPLMRSRPAVINTAAAPSRGRTHGPSQDLRHIIASHQGPPRQSTSSQPDYSGGGDIPRTSSTHDDHWRYSAVEPMLIDQEEPRPRSINGHVFPARVHLDLHAGPSRRRSISPSIDTSSDRSEQGRQHGGQSEERHRLSDTPRSHSPVLGDKRARSPDDEDVRDTQAQKLSDHHGRSRAKDFDDTTQEAISLANTWFRCLLATRDAFPDHTTESEMLVHAWDKSCEELKISMRITPDIAKLITRRGPQMRGEIKTKVRSLIELVFGFESGQNKRNVRKNRQLAEDLKEGMGYCYKEYPADAERRKGLYKAKIIQKSANLMWFNNRRDEGAMHPEVFGPILPKPAFALILSAIECGIDEWATGVKTDVPFTSADYRSVYLDHLKALDDFEKHTASRDILGNILTRVHNIGRFHSGASPLTSAPSASTLSKAALDAAIREYDEDEETESDGENGEKSD